ncbi:hypothetical protein BDZ85DRAFT_204867, partial [Elsinoe ampelina]
MATVIVGPAQVKFLLHTELLVSVSPFFAAALQGHFAESASQTVTLPEEKPEMFEWFVQWLYTGSLSTAGATNCAPPQEYFLLIDLYALSDRLLTTSMSNHIIDTVARLSETTNSVPTPSDTWLLYGDCCSYMSLHHCACSTRRNSVRPSSPLRDLILDLFTYKKTDRLLQTHKDDW